MDDADHRDPNATVMQTVVWRHPDRPVVMSSRDPLAVIGQRLNPSGYPRLATALRDRDMAVLQHEARRQVRAGATLLDVNVYLLRRDPTQPTERMLLPAAVEAVAAAVDVPLVLDSADQEALLAALALAPGKAIVNGLTGVARVLDALLPAIAAYRAAVIALPLDEDGVPLDTVGRLRIATRIIDRAISAGISQHDIIVDGLALPPARDHAACAMTLATLRALTNDLRVNTVVGAGNVCFGSSRAGCGTLTSTFLAMAMGAGLSCVIADPLTPQVMAAVAAGNTLLGRAAHAQ